MPDLVRLAALERRSVRAVPAIVESQHRELLSLDARVDDAEGEGLRARWEFGAALLRRRVGKQLPNGLLDELVAETGKSRAELKQRVKFAEDYPEVAKALATFKSWDAFVNRPKQSLPELRVAKPLPDGQYRAIVADPPWQYDNKATRGAAENHYSTMTISELCDLDIETRSGDDSHLYLWVTNGFIREGFDVLAAWGFTYKTSLTWVKPQIGLGNYFRSATEHVLFGVRGKLATNARDVPNWFEARRSQHSRKPDCFYDLVEKCSPGPYLELFSRRRRIGWDAWGNEA